MVLFGIFSNISFGNETRLSLKWLWNPNCNLATAILTQVFNLMVWRVHRAMLKIHSITPLLFAGVIQLSKVNKSTWPFKAIKYSVILDPDQTSKGRLNSVWFYFIITFYYFLTTSNSAKKCAYLWKLKRNILDNALNCI